MENYDHLTWLDFSLNSVCHGHVSYFYKYITTFFCEVELFANVGKERFLSKEIWSDNLLRLGKAILTLWCANFWFAHLYRSNWIVKIASLSHSFRPLDEFLYVYPSVHSYQYETITDNAILFWCLATRKLQCLWLFIILFPLKSSHDQIFALWLARMCGYSEISACGFVPGLSICSVSNSVVSREYSSACINITFIIMLTMFWSEAVLNFAKQTCKAQM